MRTDEIGAIPYEKSNNVETNILLSQGRITRKAFFLRLLLCVIIWVATHAVYVYWARAEYLEYEKIGGGKIQDGARMVETRYNICKAIDFYAIPFILVVFITVQAIKRVHDTNNSGWYLLMPFYNIYLILSKGSDGDNDYGLMPNQIKKNPSYNYSNTSE